MSKEDKFSRLLKRIEKCEPRAITLCVKIFCLANACKFNTETLTQASVQVNPLNGTEIVIELNGTIVLIDDVFNISQFRLKTNQIERTRSIVLCQVEIFQLLQKEKLI